MVLRADRRRLYKAGGSLLAAAWLSRVRRLSPFLLMNVHKGVWVNLSALVHGLLLLHAMCSLAGDWECRQLACGLVNRGGDGRVWCREVDDHRGRMK